MSAHSIAKPRFRERFAAKLGEVLDYHNLVLKNYFQAGTVDYQKILDDTLALAEHIKPLVMDVPSPQL